MTAITKALIKNQVRSHDAKFECNQLSQCLDLYKIKNKFSSEIY